MNRDQQLVSTLSSDPELEAIVSDEERCLRGVLEHLADRSRAKPERPSVDYDAEMLALRDEMATARLEDVPPLLEQMERLQGLAARRRELSEGSVDASSPYFGHLVLREGDRQREVLIGRSTYLDTKVGVRIVDWRDAPVSRLYYRYEEGDEYEETFGDREILGEVVARRSVGISGGVLYRVGSPQGTFVRRRGTWQRMDERSSKLHGGQGAAVRAEEHHRFGKLGVGAADDEREDKHLKEITALIDPRQFELLTHSASGLVVIQGGAGSGKTTIGLHRLAYLAYHDKRRFRPDRMLVVVFNDALARYISQVLPALDIEGVAIRTYTDWAARIRSNQVCALPRRYADETPNFVTRLKKHPVMLRLIDEYVRRIEEEVSAGLAQALGEGPAAQAMLSLWKKSAGAPLAHRAFALARAAEQQSELPIDARVRIERLARRAADKARDVMGAWADILTDKTALTAAFAEHAPSALSAAELNRAHAWCTARAPDLVQQAEERPTTSDALDRRSHSPRESDGESNLGIGVDGRSIEEQVLLDREDDTLLLRLSQKLRGPLLRGGKSKEALIYEHVFIDEAQDLSPVELCVVLDTVSKAKSVTLAGDVAQRLYLDNGFSDWSTVLSELGLSHVAIEPLSLSYRSTKEIMDFARAVLGPLAPEEPGKETKSGAPVELFHFAHAGDATAFLSENLRRLMQEEPRASVAVVARYPAQADLYFAALEKAEVPRLRRIADQDFPFKPGIDVTDVRQVKGLEFDYVVIVESSEATYPADDESRHLLHIAATRAAHQLWALSTGKPSVLLPAALRDRESLEERPG